MKDKYSVVKANTVCLQRLGAEMLRPSEVFLHLPRGLLPTGQEIFVQEVYMKPPSGHFGCGGVTMSVSLKIQTSSFHSFSHHIAPFSGSALSLPQQIVTAPSLLSLRSQTRAWHSWTRPFGAVNSPQAGGQRSMKPAELPDLWAKLQKDVSIQSIGEFRVNLIHPWSPLHPSICPS